ncbi:MAG: PSD1 domain-containing protein [Verrucomicrobiales bacterium]|nr:PSD1 domain-containing protein [Verrucomicrobiales bacterium]
MNGVPQTLNFARALCLLVVALPCLKGIAASSASVDFNRDIRPLLSDRCFTCHGPDDRERKGGLRLDLRDAAVGPAKSGLRAIVPGQPDASELLKRITTQDADDHMPPASTGKKLTESQVELFRRWIAEGAAYRDHWAFIPPHRPPVPQASNEIAARGNPANPIDAFIEDRLRREHLTPQPQASPTTLVRRATLDLTGLPPTPEEVDAFLADRSPKAYEKLVDRLLDSPRYGERMAVDWLDAARYADTHGYHLDSGRDLTAWRDWVIQAYNENKPFDQFTVEQLAGDLLPNPTRAQRVASGFNRNHMINYEGGAIAEEYQYAYLVDRVNTTATVWLGLTMACAQCHDHKYDPLSKSDYYRFLAFFNNVPERGLDGNKGNAEPVLKLPTDEQSRRLEALNAAVAEKQKAMDAALPSIDEAQRQWESSPDAAAESVPPEVRQALSVEVDRREKKDLEAIRRFFREKRSDEYRRLKEALDTARKDRDELDRAIPSTMVMAELEKPRDTFIRLRGAYDKLGDKVTAGTPAALSSFPSGAPMNRLGLAQWLVSPDHPLTARVTVNRYWQMYFGTGLVKTAEDFGAQGDWPSHPELLDWLAREFMESGWDVKHLQRLILTSAAYRRDARVTEEHQQKDAENRLLARGPRFRLQAEFIRDQALAISGLLEGRIGGASVSPYQPAGLWEELSMREDSKNFSAQFFVQSKGSDLYRRSMYTFWKRSSPPPQMSTFDAPDRETCTVRRPRTNTPLQALVLLNDPTYLEASRKLAERLMARSGTDAERVAWAFRLATARHPGAEEQAVLLRVLAQQREFYFRHRDAAGALLKLGEAPRDGSLDDVELAAWTMLSSTLLNLDETVTKG